MKNNQKLLNILRNQKYFIFCIYEMYLTSAKGYENAGVDLSRVKRNWGNLGKNEKCARWFKCSEHFWSSFKRNIQYL